MTDTEAGFTLSASPANDNGRTLERARPVCDVSLDTSQGKASFSANFSGDKQKKAA